jgi:hypothetical protein
MIFVRAINQIVMSSSAELLFLEMVLQIWVSNYKTDYQII